MTTLRVLTLNVWNNRGEAAARAAVINSGLRQLEPDLVAFQEVLPGQLAELIDGTGLTGSDQFEAMSVPPYADRYGGTALATRRPHTLVEILDMRGADALDLPWLTLAARVPVGELGEVLFIAPTTSFRPEAEAQRERQVQAVTDLAARHRTALPTVIAGDFNAAPDSASIRYLTGKQSLNGRSTHFHDAWEIAGSGPGYTWDSINPNATEDIDLLVRQPGYRQRIDYVFLGAPLAHPDAFARVLSATLAFDKPVEGVWASDHFGVVADLDIGLLER